MPLLGKKIFSPAKPLTNKKSGETIYRIEHTGEEFKSKTEYEKRRVLYKDPIWTCQCTGHINLTYENALRSEQERYDLLKKQFPTYFEKPILELIHHSTEILDNLVDQSWTKLQQAFVIGEMVQLKVKAQGKIVRGIVVKVDKSEYNKSCNSPSSDKENSQSNTAADTSSPTKWVPPKLLPFKYNFRLEGEDKIISGIPAADLMRTNRPPSKEIIKLFIRSFALRPGSLPNSPWSVTPNLVKKYNIPGKFADLFVSPQKSAESRKKPEDQSKKRKATPKSSGPTAKKPKLDLKSPVKKQASIKDKLKSPTKSPKKTPSTPKKGNTPSKNSSPQKTPKKDTPKKTPKKQTPKKSVETVTISDSSDSENSDDLTLSDIKDGKTTPSSPRSNGSTPRKKSKSLADLAKELKTSPQKSPSKTSPRKSLGKTSPQKKEKPKQQKEKGDMKDKKKKDKPLLAKKASGKGTKQGKAAGKLSKKKTPENKSMKQMTLMDMKGKKASRTPQSSPKKNVSKSPKKQNSIKSPRKKSPVKQPPLVIRLQKSLAQNKQAVYKSLLKRCAEELQKQQRDNLPDNVKEAVIKKFNDIKEKNKIAKMSPAQREEYLKQKRIEATKNRLKQRREQNKRHEDTDLVLKPLPTPKLVPTPDGIANELFGDIAMVTQFIDCYKGLLTNEDDTPISTELLMKSLVSKEGFTYFANVLVTLLQTLLQDGIAEDYKELTVPLASIPVTVHSSSELVRLCLRKHDTDDSDGNESDHSEEQYEEYEDVPETLVEQLENTDVFSMDPEDKLQILMGLCHRLMGSYSVQDFMSEKQREAADLWKQKISNLKQKNDLKREQKKLKKEGKAADKDIAEEVEEKEDKKEEKLNNEEKKALTITSFYSKVAPEDLVDDDLGSVVRRRRVMSAKAAAEKKKLEREERIRREKETEILRKQREEELFEKNFVDGLRLSKLVLRHAPIGVDRNHNRYWLFQNVTPGIYVEKGWAHKDIDYSIKKTGDGEVSDSESSSDADSDSGSGSEEDEIKRGRKPKTVHHSCEKTIPHKGQNLWFWYDNAADLQQLLENLHPRGARESQLKEELGRLIKDLVAKVNSAKKVKSELEGEARENEMLEGFKELSNVTKRLFPGSYLYWFFWVRQYASLLDLHDMETRLMTGGLGGVENFPSWEKKLESSTTVKECGECLIEVQSLVVDKFIKGIMAPKKVRTRLPEEEDDEKDDDDKDDDDDDDDEKDEADESGDEENGKAVKKEEDDPTPKGVQRWKEAIQSCPTLSRLHLLMGILDSCIKWEKSAENAKCKICRKKGDEEGLLLCDDCNQAFHLYCLRPALLEVPKGDWYCPACIPTRLRRRTREPNYYKQLAGEDDSDESSDDLVHEENCAVCGGDEGIFPCATCPSMFHLDCHEPPLRREPRSTWKCMQCTSGIRIRKSRRQAQRPKRKYVEVDSDDDEEREDEYVCSSYHEKKINHAVSDHESARSRRAAKQSRRKSQTSDEENVEPSKSKVSSSNSRRSSAKHSLENESRGHSARTSRRSSQEMNGSVDHKEEKEVEIISDLIMRMMRHRHSWPFHDAVDADEVPDYYEIVKEPMDLQTMQAKCASGKYRNAQDFVSDVALMFDNADLYNKDDSEVGKCVAPFEKNFLDMRSRYFPDTYYSRDFTKSVHVSALGDHAYSSPAKP